MTDQKPLTDNERLRAFAQGLIDEANHIVEECGVVGGRLEVERAEVARQLIALVDSLPSPTSPDRLPKEIRNGIDRYAQAGIRTGDCLYRILAGDLFGAFSRADDRTMPAIVAYIANQLPSVCHGSEAIVNRWIARPRS